MNTSINPFTGEVLRSFDTISDKELQARIDRSLEVFFLWRQRPLQERLWNLNRLGELLLTEKEFLSGIITSETGKPVTQSRSEIEKCAWVCRYYAEHAENQLATREVQTDAARSYVRYEPLGPVLAIMPWNYPFWQVFRFAVPALAAGNVCLLKHAPNVWICAEQTEALFRRAGFPEGSFQTLFIEEGQVEKVIRSSGVRAVTLTGSTRAGSAVGSLCGKYLKKSVMELGGSNALCVFPDADIGESVPICVEARFQNTGQSCIAGKRLLLHESIADTFLARLVAAVKALRSGDPMGPDTYIGVMAREDLAIQLEKQMQQSLAMGASLACGGQRKGTYFQPTVLTNVTPEMPVFREETFGPLLSVSTFSSEEEGIALAMDTRYGLGITLFTRDQDRIQRLVSSLDDAAVFVNAFVKSDPRLPFGGVRASGFGRELSIEGILEFVNIKTVYIK